MMQKIYGARVYLAPYHFNLQKGLLLLLNVLSSVDIQLLSRLLKPINELAEWEQHKLEEVVPQCHIYRSNICTEQNYDKCTCSLNDIEIIYKNNDEYYKRSENSDRISQERNHIEDNVDKETLAECKEWPRTCNLVEIEQTLLSLLCEVANRLNPEVKWQKNNLQKREQYLHCRVQQLLQKILW